MGKGQRAREARSQAKIENPQIKSVKKKQNGGKKWVTPLVTVLVIVLVVGVFALTYLSDNGIILRGRTVMETENFEVSGTMMQYAVMSTYQNFVNTYADVLSYFGLDTSKSLDSQQYGDGTWLDWFKESAQTSLNQTLIYAEAAKEAGFELDDEDKKTIEDNIASLSTSAAINGYTEKAYMAMLFGKGVNKNDIRDFYEITTLANKYELKIYDDTEAAITQEEIDAYYAENIDTLAVADVLTYSETIKIDATLSEEEKEAKKSDLLSKMEAISAATGEEEFKSALLAYLTEKAAAEEKSDAEATPEKQLEDALVTLTKSEVELSEAADWLFELDGETHVRQAGEAKTFVEDEDSSSEETEEEAKDTEYTVEVYYIVKAPYADDKITKNAGHILVAFDSYETSDAAKAKAEEILAEYKAGEMTKESFEALGEQYTDDSNVFYDNITVGQMVEEFEAWIYDDAREIGDTDIVETTYGYHVMYFVGDGDPAWIAKGRTAVVGEKTGDIYTEYEEKYAVTVNDSAMNAVRG